MRYSDSGRLIQTGWSSPAPRRSRKIIGNAPEELVQAVRQVHQGWVIVSPEMAGKLMGDFSEESTQSGPLSNGATDSLSAREWDVLKLLADGSSNREIADGLIVAENTVKTHMRSILTKLHLKNRTQAAAYARSAGSAR